MILKHRGVDPIRPIVPLAHLGLARARAGAGDVDGAAARYDDLFTIWQNADADFAPPPRCPGGIRDAEAVTSVGDS